MKIFLIADSHFDALDHMRHVFPRPEFQDNDHMNQEMIKRWNSVVSQEDKVISVGDFCYTDPRPWIQKLNGHITLLRGNHDEWCEGFAGEWNMILEHGGKQFYLTHDPAWVPNDWKNWVIHGHHHWMPEFPHINGPMKNINVAADLIDFTPVSLDEILSTKDLEKTVMMTRPSSYYKN